MSRAFTDNINCFNNVWNNCTFATSDDESKIMAWLSPLEPQVRHHDIRNQRVDRIGDWLLDTREFRSWYNGCEESESSHATLFCYGDPGTGKSYISSLVVDYLCDQAGEQDMAVACLYYDFASREEQSPTNMLGSLLKQLLSGLGSIPMEITRKFRGQKKAIGGRGIQLLDIVDMFPAVSCFQRTFICVDALDECVPKHRLEVLDALRQILRRSPNTRMFMTGRPHICGAVERELGCRTTSVSIKPKDDDIVTYLRARLRKDTTPEVMDSRLQNDIIKNIPVEISESFILVSLKVEAILRETTIHRRRKRLNAREDGLGLRDAYAATLERIRAQDAEKAKLAVSTLMWICYSERPLHVDELRHALAVEIGSADFNSDNVSATETLLTCCQGLVIVDKKASIARLLHHTLREYLSTDPNFFGPAHSVMAETCLTYLNLDQVKALSATPEKDLLSTPFLKYSSRYWGTHANKELSDHAKFLALELLEQYEDHVAAESLFEQILEPYDSARANAPSHFSGLHCASFFGIIELMAGLLGINGSGTNRKDSAGITPLIWAVRNGQAEAVKLLLKQESIDPDKPDNEGNTPLSWAAMKVDESVIKQLLDRADVGPDRPDDRGRTPLSWAAMEGQVLAVKMLLDREDVNPDRPDSEGITPLSWAAMKGHGSVVMLLLDRKDVCPHMPDNEGMTPLSWASNNGHGSVVKQLLDQKEVTPDRQDKKGKTPLSRAAMKGHESVVKLLLGRKDVNPNKPHSKGSTPLSLAATKGHELVVQQLLGRKDVNPDIPDNTGNTPLSWAAMKGYESVVKQLLDRSDVSPDKPNRSGLTPLSCAVYHGHESVVKQLLDQKDVNPDMPDSEGATSLSWAASQGHESIVKQLLDRVDVHIDMPDNKGNTPLSWAAIKGYESVVKQLLDRDDVNPDIADNEGNTPLSWAAMEGHESVVKQLLDREDVNPDIADNEGNTPLSWAAMKGHESVVKQLLDRGDVSPDKPTK